ncbi:MAG: FHA domain-containing protein [Anaerolineae bacterium]|nr:FHA domain-containing protein [Anaerolineae bacterium]
MKCPNCGHENRVGELICGNCGKDLYNLLYEEATKHLSPGRTRDLQPRPMSLSEARPIMLYVGNITMPIAIERLNDQIIGRSDKMSGVVVDIDLSDFDGQDWGVSRRHARLDAHKSPMITDLGSYNGTFINGERLEPEQAYALNSGDELRLGRLITFIYYK